MPEPLTAPPTHSPPCVLCGGEGFHSLLEGLSDVIWARPGSFALARCEGCGLVATRPRPADADLGFYYEGAYSGAGAALDMGGFYAGPVGRLLNAYRRVTIEKQRPLTAEDRVLEVGCSQGYFLQALRQDRGCQTAGIDLDAGSIAAAVDPEACDYAVARVADAPFDAESFSLVCFYECLEHETDPVGALRAAARLLAPGGLCVVEVPDFGSPLRALFGRSWLPLLVPQHISHFDRASLAATFRAAGLEVVHAQSMLFPGELCGSLAIAVVRALDLKPLPDAEKGAGRRIFEGIFGLWLLLLFGLVDVPVQLFLRLIQRSGHQTLIGRKSGAAPQG